MPRGWVCKCDTINRLSSPNCSTCKRKSPIVTYDCGGCRSESSTKSSSTNPPRPVKRPVRATMPQLAPVEKTQAATSNAWQEESTVSVMLTQPRPPMDISNLNSFNSERVVEKVTSRRRCIRAEPVLMPVVNKNVLEAPQSSSALSSCVYSYTPVSPALVEPDIEVIIQPPIIPVRECSVPSVASTPSSPRDDELQRLWRLMSLDEVKSCNTIISQTQLDSYGSISPPPLPAPIVYTTRSYPAY
eukprot:TRINITY_DN27983_c0_g1_i1.p1 TRINITY_DN27983_c0_g1~~TRINITY_DN27983_c0_g1_i1.p1  ORF type:complete len:244 (+),score=33.42 TRINITY_DN27983_c0_g1_i1:47-778(+)